MFRLLEFYSMQFLTMNIKDKNKINFLSSTLAGFFSEKMNLARIKFFGLYISALCKVQTVCYDKLAIGFDSDAKVAFIDIILNKVIR
jgi:hypothetical protein